MIVQRTTSYGRLNVKPRVGLFGFGAFGKLIAKHLSGRCDVLVHDPAAAGTTYPLTPGVALADLETCAACPIVVLAVPVSSIEEVAVRIAPLLAPDALVLDVGSVKIYPSEIMRAKLPRQVGILATHPLFGPESAKNGIAGHKIVLCPIRGRNLSAVKAFLRDELGLRVIVASPEEHDRQLAASQGLTHLIARVLVMMEPLPEAMTTASFDLLMRAVEMVRHDSQSVFSAIEQLNPYSKGVRDRFFHLASALRSELEGGDASSDAPHGLRVDNKSTSEAPLRDRKDWPMATPHLAD